MSKSLITEATEVLLNEAQKYYPFKQQDVHKGSELGGWNLWPKIFKSKIEISCWKDVRKGTILFVAQGDDPNVAGTKTWPTAEHAHKELA